MCLMASSLQDSGWFVEGWQMTRRNTPQVRTFGCRLNIWESEVLREQAGAAGLSDAIIFNTCAVTV